MKFRHMITGEMVEPTDWQLGLQVGDYYRTDQSVAMVGETIFDNIPTIYGHIESDEECEPGWFLVRAYSQWCLKGELGLMCIIEPSCKLTQEEFEAARAAGWPDLKEQTDE